MIDNNALTQEQRYQLALQAELADVDGEIQTIDLQVPNPIQFYLKDGLIRPVLKIGNEMRIIDLNADSWSK